MRKRKPTLSRSSNNAMTIAAIIVSFCALAVSVYQSIILRNQQYASVWPYIEPRVEYDNHSFSLYIQNKGTGPAIVKDIILTLDGKEATDHMQFIRDLLQVDQFVSVSISSPKNTVLSAEEKVLMLHAIVPDSVSIKADFPQRTVLEICYCSIFGDCWQYVDGKVTDVNSCRE